MPENESQSILKQEELMVLHRHWMWATVIKGHFEEEVKSAATDGGAPKAQELFPDAFGAYMSIWYGMLFGVLEGLRQKEVVIPEIQSDIDSIYCSLRQYRNAVFHPQPRYWSPKFEGFVGDRESVEKIWRIHSGLGGWFLKQFDLRDSERKNAAT